MCPVLLVLALLSACGIISPSVDSLLASAKKEQEAGRHGAAVIQLRNVLQKAPKNAEATYLLGVEFHRTGDFGYSASVLKAAFDLKYDPVKVVPPLCKSLLALGRYERVLELTEVPPVGDSAAQAEWATLRGLALIGQGKINDGAELLARALEIQPEFAGALWGKALLAIGEGKYGDAAGFLERAVAASPRDLDVWMLKGDLQRHLKQDGALAAYQKVLEIDPENIPARLTIASMRVGAGDLDGAQQVLDEALTLAPTTPMVKYTEGLIQFRRGNYAAAQTAADKVLVAAPDHVPSLLLAGVAAYTRGSYADAQTHLGRLVDLAPTNLELRRLLALSFARGGNPQRALDVLAGARASAGNDVELLGLAGEFALQNNDPLLARDFFEKALKVDPKNANARTGLGASRLAWGETDRALADLETAVRLDSASYQADVLLVLTYLQRKRFDLALKAATGLEQKQPANPLTHNLKGAAYLGLKDAANARRVLLRALELQPTYAPAAINLARLDESENNPRAARLRLEALLAKDEKNVQILLTLGELGPAIGATTKEQTDWLERAMQAAPTMVAPKVMLARILAQRGEPKKAVELVAQARAIAPNSAEVLDLQGRVELAAGNPRNALAAFDKLVSVQPKSAVARYWLGRTQAAIGNKAAADGAYRAAIALQPSYIDPQIALAGLELHAGRHAEAMQLARQVQKQAAQAPVGYLLEGDVLMAERKFAQAAKAYEAGYQVEKSGALVLRMHDAHTEAGNPDLADARLAQWLAIAPDDAIARLYSADVSLRNGRYPNAIEQYEWLQRKQPENIIVLNNLAVAYHRVKDPRALATAERAYELKPDNPAVGDTLGWLLVEQGSVSRGVELLQAAAAAAPAAAEIRFHLAQGLLKAGEPGKARNELERLLDTPLTFPSRPEAVALLAELRKPVQGLPGERTGTK